MIFGLLPMALFLFCHQGFVRYADNLLCERFDLDERIDRLSSRS